jgi:hypothetical protein
MGLTSIVEGFVLMTLSDYIGRAKSLVRIHSLLALSILFIIFAQGDIFDLTLSFPCFKKNPDIKNRNGGPTDGNLSYPLHAFLFLHFFC